MGQRVIYNVLVMGYSVGMTFSHHEAIAWKQSATSTDVRIVAVPYFHPEERRDTSSG